jgi:hypothetical protein
VLYSWKEFSRIRNFCRIHNSRVSDLNPGPYPKMDENINKNLQKKGEFHDFDYFYVLHVSVFFNYVLKRHFWAFKNHISSGERSVPKPELLKSRTEI